MPRYAVVSVPAQTITELTANDVTEISFQPLGYSNLVILLGTNLVAPTNPAIGWRYAPDTADKKLVLADLGLGFGAPAANRVFAWCEVAQSVMVSHA